MKNNTIFSILAALLIGFGVGQIMASFSDVTEVVQDTSHSTSHDEDDSHSAEETDGHMHGGMYNVPVENAPSVAISVSEDAKSGWNVSLQTDNFAFTPEEVNGDNVLNQGHAHLYVDGKKINRLYSSNYHYDVNFDGAKTFRVTLNANDHSEYAVDGVVVEDSIEIIHEAHD